MANIRLREAGVSGEPSIGSPPRRKLADITNLQECSKQLNQPSKCQSFLSLSSKEYIEKLEKENTTLVKVLEERNKLVQFGETELQKCRIDYQILQQQNLRLAQANSGMLAELNSKRDRLKALEHELGCVNGLQNARQVYLEVGANRHVGDGESLLGCDGNVKAFISKRGRQTGIRCADNLGQLVQVKGNADNKRVSGRRKSSNYEPVEMERNSVTPAVTIAEENVNKKRLCSRGQSARCKTEELEAASTMSAVNDADQNTENKRVSGKRKSGNVKSEELEWTYIASAVISPDENVNDRRHSCARRQAARRKSQEPECTHTLHETTDHGKNCAQSMGIPLRSSDRCNSQERDPTTRNLHDATDSERTAEAHSDKIRVRRQSAKIKSNESVPTQDLSATGNPGCQVCQSQEHMAKESRAASSGRQEEIREESNRLSGTKAIQTSNGRPSRRAAEKIQSYKELPLNVKMRRPE